MCFLSFPSEICLPADKRAPLIREEIQSMRKRQEQTTGGK